MGARGAKLPALSGLSEPCLRHHARSIISYRFYHFPIGGVRFVGHPISRWYVWSDFTLSFPFRLASMPRAAATAAAVVVI